MAGDEAAVWVLRVILSDAGAALSSDKMVGAVFHSLGPRDLAFSAVETASDMNVAKTEDKPAAPTSWGASGGLAIYLLTTVLFSAIAIVFNVAMMFVLFNTITPYILEYFVLYVGQFLIYIGSVSLLFLEWRLWDSITEPLYRGS